MIGAVMGRTSKEKDDSFSVASQVDAGLAYAETNGITIPTEYIFREDFSGRVLDRPELNRIRTLLREKKIQALIVFATDRLARRTGVGEIILDEIMENGVQLHIIQWGTYIKDTPEDRLRFNFETTFSSFERDKFMERGKRGKQKKASMGFIVGNNKPAYGYKVNDMRTNFELTEYAAVAREILILYGIEHMKNFDIYKLMEAKGYPTPGKVEYDMLLEKYNKLREQGFLTDEEYARKLRYAARRLGGGKWGYETIYNIIRKHEFYAGKFTFSIFGDNFTVDVPAVITQEESEEVRKALEVGRIRTERKNPTKYNFLMSRRLRCAHCGLAYVIMYNARGNCYYNCFGKAKKSYQVCTTRPIRRDIVDERTKVFVRELLLNPTNLFAWWEEQHAKEIEEGGQLTEQIAAMHKRIEQTTQKYHRTLDRLTDALDVDEITYYTQQRDSIKQLLDEYREELQRLEEKLVLGRAGEEVVQDFLSMGEEYREILETSDDFTFWRGLVDDLDITALLGDDDMGRYIEFIVFGKTRKRFYLTTEPNDEGGEQVKLIFRLEERALQEQERFAAIYSTGCHF